MADGVLSVSFAALGLIPHGGLTLRSQARILAEATVLCAVLPTKIAGRVGKEFSICLD